VKTNSLYILCSRRMQHVCGLDNIHSCCARTHHLHSSTSMHSALRPTLRVIISYPGSSILYPGSRIPGYTYSIRLPPGYPVLEYPDTQVQLHYTPWVYSGYPGSTRTTGIRISGYPGTRVPEGRNYITVRVA